MSEKTFFGQQHKQKMDKNKLFQRILCYVIFFMFFIITGCVYFYLYKYVDIIMDLLFPFITPQSSRWLQDIIYSAPLWLFNIVIGIPLGIFLRLFNHKKIGWLILLLFLGCILSEFSWFFTFANEYSKIMSDF